jgi:hypothetical protein
VLTAVDGSVVRTLASLAEAAYLTDRNGQRHCGLRFHIHFEIDRNVPVHIAPPARSRPMLRHGPLVWRVRALE